MINNYQKTSAKHCAKSLGRTNCSVWAKAERLKLLKPRLKIKMDQFHNPTSFTAYLLGLIWADGHLGDYRVSFSLKSSDAKHLKSKIAKTGKWHVHVKPPPRSTWKEVTIFRSGDNRLFKLLSSLDYKTKSFNDPELVLKYIPKNLHYLFWRGYFDGDGCLHIVKGYKYAALAFSGNYELSWKSLSSLLNKIGATYRIARQVYKKGHKDSKLIICNKQSIKKMCSYIYHNRGRDKIGLSRKHKTYLKFLKLNPEL